MLLQETASLVYGAGGAVGGAVAKAFAREGARVILAGRTTARLEKVASEIHLNIYSCGLGRRAHRSPKTRDAPPRRHRVAGIART